jgi:hypothetical protein
MAINSMVDMETFLINKVADPTIDFFLRKFGIDVQIIRKKTDNVDTERSEAAKNVYGVFSGYTGARSDENDIDPTVDVEFEAKILLASVNRNAWDDTDVGALEEFNIYTKEILFPGDEFFIPRDDGQKKGFRITEQTAVGTTLTVIKRFVATSLGGV